MDETVSQYMLIEQTTERCKSCKHAWQESLHLGRVWLGWFFKRGKHFDQDFQSGFWNRPQLSADAGALQGRRLVPWLPELHWHLVMVEPTMGLHSKCPMWINGKVGWDMWNVINGSFMLLSVFHCIILECSKSLLVPSTKKTLFKFSVKILAQH